MKTPKIFFDASLKNNQDIGIGLFDYSSKETKSIQINYKTNSSKVAEELAFKEAIKFAVKKYNKAKEIHFFTDNQGLYHSFKTKFVEDKKINLFWIPREMNSAADKMSKIKETNNKVSLNQKKTRLNKSISAYIREKYSLNHRLALINKIAFSSQEKRFVKDMFKEKIALDSGIIEFYNVIYSLLTKSERPKCFKNIVNFPGFKNDIGNDIEKRLKLLV